MFFLPFCRLDEVRYRAKDPIWLDRQAKVLASVIAGSLHKLSPVWRGFPVTLEVLFWVPKFPSPKRSQPFATFLVFVVFVFFTLLF